MEACPPQTMLPRHEDKIKITLKIISAVALLMGLPAQYGLSVAAAPAQYSYKPEAGYIPDEETAIRIAVAVWVPIYGKERIKREKPYTALLKNGIWYVSGSVPQGLGKGGVAEAEIAKEDGRILRISHGK